MSIIRTNDYKKYVAFKKTVDDLYPDLPVSDVGIFSQLAKLYTDKPDWLNDEKTIDLEYCLRSGEKWLNKLGAAGLNFNSNTHEFGDSTALDVKTISEMLLSKHGTRWDKLYKLYVEDYDPLKNWDATENHDGEWTKNGTEDRDKTTTYTGTMSKSHNFGENGHITKVEYNGDLVDGVKGEMTTRSYDDYKETKNGGRQTYHEDEWETYTEHKNTDKSGQHPYTETYTQTTPSLSSDETLKSGFNTPTNANEPVTITTNTQTGAGTISSVANYNPAEIVVHNSTDGSNTNVLSGCRTEVNSDNGKRTFDEYIPDITFDGFEGTYSDTKTGGHTTTESGEINETTSFDGRSDSTTGGVTYGLDGTNDEYITYSGFFDRMGVNRSDIYMKEWEARMRVFLNEVFKDVDNLITLKIY